MGLVLPCILWIEGWAKTDAVPPLQNSSPAQVLSGRREGGKEKHLGRGNSIYKTPLRMGTRKISERFPWPFGTIVFKWTFTVETWKRSIVVKSWVMGSNLSPQLISCVLLDKTLNFSESQFYGRKKVPLLKCSFVVSMEWCNSYKALLKTCHTISGQKIFVGIITTIFSLYCVNISW